MLFTDADVGFPKSVVLVNGVNRFFGTNWKAVTERYDEDFVKSSLQMGMAIGQPKSKKFETVGSLPMVTDEFPGLLAVAEEKDNGYNCSASAALLEQDLFINTLLAYFGVEILK